MAWPFSNKPKSEHSMGVLDHMEDLRRALLRSFAVFLIACIAMVGLIPWLAQALTWPLHIALSEESTLMQGLVTTSPMGVFSVVLQVCFMGGLALALPWMLFFLGQFVAPGLDTREKRVLIPACGAVLGLFLMGASFGYFLVLPASLRVAIELNRMLGFELIWNASNYYGLVVWMTAGIGLCFEFPVILLVLMKMGIVSYSTLRALRRHMVIVILIASALITPGGDPLSLLLLAGPLYLLYEIALWIGKRSSKPSEEEPVEQDWLERVASAKPQTPR